MPGFDHFVKIEQLKARDPQFAESLNEAVKQRENPRRIRNMIQSRTGAHFTTEEVKAYLQDLWVPERRAEAVAALEAASRGAGEGGVESATTPGRLERALDAVTSGATGATQGRGYEIDDEHIYAVLWQQLRIMLEEAMSNPSSDAAKMLEILAFRQLLMDRTRVQEVDFMKFYGEQSRRKLAEARLIEAQTTVWQAEDEVEAAQAQGRAFDYQKAFDQISAVIGLGQPLVEQAPPEVGSSEGMA